MVFNVLRRILEARASTYQVTEDIMAAAAKPVASTATKPAAFDISHVSEVLEVANTILRRHQNDELVQKTFLLQGYLEMSRTYPERDYNEVLHKALADLTAAVHLHLNSELHAITSLFGRLS
jgi:hypothetical protein